MGQLRHPTGAAMGDLAFDFEAEIDAKDVLRRASLKADGNTSSESAALRGRHSIVCKHWLRNLCMKGEKCDFLHQYDPNRMPECIFWLKFGKCNDPDCVFRHVAPSERPECQRYRLGFCRHGAMCRSRHDRLPPDALPELLPDWFLDSLILNAHLVPRSDEVNLSEFSRDRGRNGLGPGSELALVPLAPSTEQGTIPGLPPPIHGKCRYFVMRSMIVRNIQISAAKGIWATSLGNSQKLRQGYRDVDHVVLIFSATESRNFQGYGKMTCEPDTQLFPGIWGELSCRLSPNFRVHWIKQCTAPLSHADHIKNPQNDDLPVRRCRDGQELPPSVGERLCRFLWQQADTDLLKGTELELEPRVSYDRPPLPPPGHGDPRALRGPEPALPPAQGAPLAIEDIKKDGHEKEGDASRPAPVPVGTFQRDARDGKGRLGGGPVPVTVGKALASGSSSLLAAMTEEAQQHLPPAPSVWPPGPMGWRPMPPPSGEWLPPGAPRYPPPPHSYYPPDYRPYHYPPPGPSVVPPAVCHYGEVRPPGYWGAPAPQPGGERRALGLPPAEWEGASAAAVVGADPRLSGGHRSRSPRSRSRRRGRHKRKK